MLKNIDKLNWAAIGVIAAIIIGIPAWLTYINTSRPEIIAQGKTNQWFIPEPISGMAPLKTNYIGSLEPSVTSQYFNNVRTYVEFSIENTGSAVAEDVQLHLPYSGVFSSDFGQNLEIFDRKININELRPKEPKYVWIWTNVNEKESINKGFINFKNGSEDVDFAVVAYGKWKSILLLLARFWVLGLILALFIIALLIANVFDKSSGNIISPTNLRARLKIINAIYGSDTSNVEVTGILNDKINHNGILDVIVSNDLAGDPHYGVQKKLKIKYQFENKEFDRVYLEGVRIRLP